MFRIHRLAGALSPEQERLLKRAQAIIRSRFPSMSEEEIEARPELLADPIDKRFLAELLVAENQRQGVMGAAWLLFAPEEGFAWLDVIAVTPKSAGRGVGAAIYERAREVARALHGDRPEGGLYFECSPDEPELSPDPERRAINAKRIAFYERLDAHPVIGTAYETPLQEGESDPPYLMFDGLGQYQLPEARTLRDVIRAVLERKYRGLCPPEYVEKVIGSVKRGGYALRRRQPGAPKTESKSEPKNDAKSEAKVGTGAATAGDAKAAAGSKAHAPTHAPAHAPALAKAPPAPTAQTLIPLIVNEGHEIHHIRERGYVEAPVRVASILSALDATSLFKREPAEPFSDEHLLPVHDPGLIEYIRRVCEATPKERSVYPYVFPIRNAARPPADESLRAGYWCIDTFTPLNRNAYPAARAAVDCALTAAKRVEEGAHLAYALVRPPGHHAERRAFGGFCYFNNAAVAANYLAHERKVALLDIDFHHGNGQQDIFYSRGDVLTVSIHGDPSIAYPYFSGFADETGEGDGLGCNLNFPLPEITTPQAYREALAEAIRAISAFKPDYLVLALGLDTGKGDPTGSWSNTPTDFEKIGRMIGEAGWPTVVIQEGGYRVRTLGPNASRFFQGLWTGAHAGAPAKPAKTRAPKAPRKVEGVRYRTALAPADAIAIEALVRKVGNFHPSEIAIARELADERLQKGAASGYEFIIAEEGGRMIGYLCWGPTPCTKGRFDVYWIAVDPKARRSGVGAELHRRAEASIAALGGQRIYIETSSTAPYEAARKFYERMGYSQAARLADFYADGDDKVLFVKKLPTRDDAAVKKP